MKATQTNIPDITRENINKAKVGLADKIIKEVYPLLDEILVDKDNLTTKLQEEAKQKKEKVGESKKFLEGLFSLVKKEQLKEKVLDRISKLSASQIVKQSPLKNEMVVFLKVMDKLSEEKLNQYLSRSLTSMSKKINK